MANLSTNSLKYLAGGLHENAWGIEVTTVGYQSIEPNAAYPAMQHPSTYNFRTNSGRVLDEYQIVYITEGEGFFESASKSRCRVKSGTVFFLYPGERHSYAPDKKQGWSEYWIGFKGKVVNHIFESNTFPKNTPILTIGLSNTLTSLYQEAIRLAEKENIGYQQLLAGLVVHMLGQILYKHKNRASESGYAEEIINEGCKLMRERLHHSLRAEEIAQSLGVGYSWFRQTFKRVIGVSPSHYITLLLMSYAKELLVTENKSITETAYILGYDNVGQFSTAFRKIEGVSPSHFREENRLHYSN